MLGTLGRFALSSLLFLFPTLDVGAAGTVFAMPFDPSAGLEGFEEEYLRWWERYDMVWDASALVVVFRVEIEGVAGAFKATRRTDDENMPPVANVEIRKEMDDTEEDCC